ncbi:RidA family protein [Clostridium sp. AM58-1XD]|uniref:RidA family protein n=1 Tax=Clostridium sp. AM58-1XD TaxID=2292307 RepID=UPI001A9A3D8B|nr:RidA family protein [Clostridium sp. AM58-1XD]
MKEMGLELPAPPKPGGVYSAIRQVGNSLYFTAGVGCKKNGDLLYTGHVGEEISIEEGRQAARQSIFNLLSIIEREIGDLRRITKIVKILGFVSCQNGFEDQPKVIDAASELLIQIFGEEIGYAARSAIGTNSLPGNQAVEIEMVFETEWRDEGEI